MEQAKYYVCRSCSTSVPMGNKFCGRCGAFVPDDVVNQTLNYYGALQAPGKAKLILIRGTSSEGLSYQLGADSHSIGKRGQIKFPDDPFVSAKHARFFYQEGRLFVEDQNSPNGIYLRIRQEKLLVQHDMFLAGNQIFRFQLAEKALSTDSERTQFSCSPQEPDLYLIHQILEGGRNGLSLYANKHAIQIGREKCDLNFPDDVHLNRLHCKIEKRGEQIFLSDLGTHNGTFVRIRQQEEMKHGDYLFIGRELLRIEINAS